MEFSKSLMRGQLKQRYKRFFADIQTAEGIITAHVPNTGSLKGCLWEKATCLYSHVDDPKRKLAYTLQMIAADNSTNASWIGVNTSLTNQLVWEAYNNGRIESWTPYLWGRREVKVSAKTRLDFMLAKTQEDGEAWLKDPTSRKPLHFIEVKNVTLADGDKALFPDCVTSRGLKHLNCLLELVQLGHTAEICYVIQRSDCTSFSPAADIDPDYAAALKKVLSLGVTASVYACDLNEKGVVLNPLPIHLDF